MTKYRVKNLTPDETKTVRIYKVSKDGELKPTDLFTQLDTSGNAIGVSLLPKPIPQISCDGALPVTGVIEIDGPISFAMGESDSLVEYATPEELISAITSAGLVVEILPPDPFESTEIFISNTRIDPTIPLDGSKSYVMDVSLVTNGTQVENVPFNISLTNPPYSHEGMNYNIMPFMMWMSMSLLPVNTGIFSYFTSKLFDNDPSILALEKINFTGNLEEEVDNVDIIELSFMPTKDLPAGAVDYYDTIFGTDYPNGVIVKTYGKKRTSDVGKAALSSGGNYLGYVALAPDIDVRLSKVNTGLTRDKVALPENVSVLQSNGFDYVVMSEDETVMLGNLKYNPKAPVPALFGYLINSESDIRPLEFDLNEHTQETVVHGISISSDNRVIVATTFSKGITVFLRDKVNHAKYKAVLQDAFVSNVLDATILPNTTVLLTRGSYSGSQIYKTMQLTIDYDIEAVTIETLGDVQYSYTGAYTAHSEFVVLPNGIIDQVTGKLIYVDATVLTAPVVREIYTDAGYLEINGSIPRYSLYTLKVGGSDKIVYTSTGDSGQRIVIGNIDLTAVTVSNMTTTVKSEVVYSFPLSRELGILSTNFRVGAIMVEEPYRVKSDNTLEAITVPYTPPTEPDGESELIFANTVIDGGIPIDGTKKLVMDVTITKGGVSEVIPYEGIVDANTFPPEYKYRALEIFGWLVYTLPSQDKYNYLPSYLVADVFTNPEAVSMSTLTLGGLADADIDVMDEVLIHFSPKANIGPDEYDYYDMLLAGRYSTAGVTLRLKGRMTPTDIVFGKLSNDDSLFIHRVDKSDVAVALRKINPDLTYTNLTLPENITVDNATNLGRFETSKDGSLIIGVSDEDIAVSPIYGYLVDGDTLQSLTFDINGQTPFDSGSQVSISPNNKLITLTGYKVGPLLPCKVYIRDKVDALKFKAVGIIPNNEGFDNRTVTFISDTLVITRQYEGDGYRYSAVELTVDYDLETVTSVYKGSVLIENTSGSGLFSSEYLNVLPGTSKFIDSIADKFVLLDFTDPINPTANTIYTDNEYRTAPGTAQGTETMLMNGKFVYISILFNITVIKVWDIDLVTGAISNMVKTDNVLDIYSVFKYSDAKRVFVALVGSNLLKEKYYKVKPDNTVEVITIPYLG